MTNDEKREWSVVGGRWSVAGGRCSAGRRMALPWAILACRLPPTACCLLLLLGGCGPDRPETVSVYGRITLDGGEWPKPGRLLFAMVEPAEGFPMRPGKALFDVDGRFTAFTWEEGDGLMPGTYKVAVECWEVEPTMETAGKSHVGDPYHSAAASPLELAVKPGQGSIKLNWDVPKP